MMCDGQDGEQGGDDVNKLWRVLCPETTLVGDALQQFLGLLRSWQAGGPTRKPWLVLDLIAAPLGEEGFRRWSRSQVLLLSSSFFRRYDLKFSSMPFMLHVIYSAPDSDKARMTAQRLLNMSRAELDPYSLGLRRLFPTVDALLSSSSQATLRSDFASYGYSTDRIERMHTHVSQNLNPRAPTRSMAAWPRWGGRTCCTRPARDM